MLENWNSLMFVYWQAVPLEIQNDWGKVSEHILKCRLPYFKTFMWTVNPNGKVISIMHYERTDLYILPLARLWLLMDLWIHHQKLGWLMDYRTQFTDSKIACLVIKGVKNKTQVFNNKNHPGHIFSIFFRYAQFHE